MFVFSSAPHPASLQHYLQATAAFPQGAAGATTSPTGAAQSAADATSLALQQQQLNALAAAIQSPTLVQQLQSPTSATSAAGLMPNFAAQLANFQTMATTTSRSTYQATPASVAHQQQQAQQHAASQMAQVAQVQAQQQQQQQSGRSSPASSPGGMATGSVSADAYPGLMPSDAEELAAFTSEVNDNSLTNLIINYLPQNMQQDELKTLFATLGEVESCKLVRDKTTGQSLGYGFVNFKHADAARRAIQTMNGLRLQNKVIKVSLARPSCEAIKGANLYICGLPKQMGQRDMEELFSQCGKIITSRILLDPATGLSKGVGFIRFDTRTEAEQAIQKLHGVVPPNGAEPLTVKFANQPNATKSLLPALAAWPFLAAAAAANPATPTFTLAAAPTAAQQLAALSPKRTIVGPVASSASAATKVRYSPLENALLSPTLWTTQPTATAQSSFLGAGTFGLSSAAGTLGASTATASHQSPGAQASASGWTLFVYNLPPEAEEPLLWQLFAPFGAVQSVKLIRDQQTQKCKGYGFVTMANYEEAALTIQSLNGLLLGGRILQVSFKSPTSGSVSARGRPQ